MAVTEETRDSRAGEDAGGKEHSGTVFSIATSSVEIPQNTNTRTTLGGQWDGNLSSNPRVPYRSVDGGRLHGVFIINYTTKDVNQ